MKDSKIIFYDIRIGIFRRWRYIVVPILFFLFCIQCNILITIQYDCGAVSTSGTWMDYLMYCFKGMEPFKATENIEGFKVPVMWMLSIGLCLFINLDYPVDDLTAFGQQVIIRSGSRSQWWLSKCVWNLCSCIIYFLLAYFTVLVFCILTHVHISAFNTPEITRLVLGEIYFDSSVDLTMKIYETVLIVMLAPFLITAALSMLQMTLSLVIKPVMCFLVSISILIVSAYYMAPLAIANYSMIIRNGRFLSGGMNTIQGFIISGIIIFISIMAGIFIFKHHDILNFEE